VSPRIPAISTPTLVLFPVADRGDAFSYRKRHSFPLPGTSYPQVSVYLSDIRQLYINYSDWHSAFTDISSQDKSHLNYLAILANLKPVRSHYPQMYDMI